MVMNGLTRVHWVEVGSSTTCFGLWIDFIRVFQARALYCTVFFFFFFLCDQAWVAHGFTKGLIRLARLTSFYQLNSSKENGRLSETSLTITDLFSPLVSEMRIPPGLANMSPKANIR